MASKIFCPDTDSVETIVRETAAALRRGELVVFPTETVYGLGVLASHTDAVRRLISAKGRRSGHALSVAISGYSVLKRYAPNISPIGQRLARRCWPGPITIVADTSTGDSQIAQLPELCRQAVMPNGTTGFRVPDQPIVLKILQEVDEPVILTSANLSGSPPAVCATDAQVGLGDSPDLILDTGPAHFQVPSTVVSVVAPGYKILRAGVLTEETIERLAAKIILFISAGNTGYGLMAVAICAELLAKKLGCPIGDLQRRGYIVMSAEIPSGRKGDLPQTDREVMTEPGIPFDGYQSQPLSDDLLRRADVICVMDRSVFSGLPRLSAILDQDIARSGSKDTNRIVDQLPGYRKQDVVYCDRDVVCRDRVIVLEGITAPLGGCHTGYSRCAEEISAVLTDKLDFLLS